MKDFFTHWLSITLVLALLWFGGRGIGLIRVEQTLEESVRQAALADVLPQEIESLRIDGLSESPPSVSVIELDAPTAMVGRLRVRDLYLRIEGMRFESTGTPPVERFVPVSASSGTFSMRATWGDIDRSIAEIVASMVPGPLRPEISVERVEGQLQVVLIRGNSEQRVPAEFRIEEGGKIRLILHPQNFTLLKILPRKFKNQVVGRMPGTRGLPWVWEQEFDAEGILLRGRVQGGL